MATNDFTYGFLTPGLALLASCAGIFLGLRCTTRARSLPGLRGTRWLLLGGLSVGATGIWTMSFTAMMGYTCTGTTVYYNLPVTVLSLVVAVAVACAGLLFVGLRRPGRWTLLAAGVGIGIGLGMIHYLFMAAMRMPGRVVYDTPQLVLSFVIAIVVATALLWSVLRLDRVVTTLAASVMMGIAFTGMHYTGMAAMEMYGSSSGPAGMVMGGGGGSTAESLVLPLILGVVLVWWMMVAAIMLSPTAEEIRYDQALLARIQASMGGPALSGADRLGAGERAGITARPDWTLGRDAGRHAGHRTGDAIS